LKRRCDNPVLGEMNEAAGNKEMKKRRDDKGNNA
jgi:hypothetical protein